MCGLLQALRAHGGAATSQQAYEFLRNNGIADSADIETIQVSGETRFAKETRFARLELVGAGLLRNRSGGDWELTSDGWRCYLTIDAARALVRMRRMGNHANIGTPRERGEVGPTTGPVPTSWTKLVTYCERAATWTYVMRFGDKDLWKIGHARSLVVRLRTIRTHVPAELIGENWELYLRFPWASAISAYRMEQEVLGLLKAFRSAGERVKCSEVELLGAWKAVAGRAPNTT
jgi:hypothetical protein